MPTFVDTISISDSPAIIIPSGPTSQGKNDKELIISYNQLSSITGHLQTFFNNPTSPLYNDLTRQKAIAISLPNGLEFVSMFLAATQAGRIAAPLNPTYKKNELDFYLSDLKASAIVVPKGTSRGETEVAKDLIASAKDNNAKLVEVWYSADSGRVEYEIFDLSQGRINSLYTSKAFPKFVNFSSKFPGQCAEDEIALIIHTSGTTGKPKAVPLTHANITTSMYNIATNFHLQPSDKTYLVMPLFHVHGLIGALLSTLKSGGTSIIPPKFSAKIFWNQFVQYHATWYSAVPTIHMILLNVAPPPTEACDNLQFIRSCSSALAPETFKKLEKAFKAPVIESYGSSESAHCMTSNFLPEDGDRVPGTVGAGLNVEIKIINDKEEFLKIGEIGEVVIKGSNIMHGYLNNEKANKENFTKAGHYFRTGDQGFLNDKNFLTLTGRIKELINRGGEKISPIELDGVMLEHPNIEEAISFGVDDAKYGQAVNAAVILKKGSNLTQQELQNWLKGKLSDFKIPTKIFFVDHLPKTSTGKIQRRIIAQVFTKDHKPKV